MIVTTQPDIARQLEGYMEEILESLGPSAMAKLVLEAVQPADTALAFAPRTGPTDGSTSNPRTLLTLLTYCYGVAMYNPADIDRALEDHAVVKYLAARSYPTPDQLRHFRRDHRSLVTQSIVRFFERVWISGRRGNAAGHDHGDLSTSLIVQFGRLAEEHLLLALLWDGPALRD